MSDRLFFLVQTEPVAVGRGLYKKTEVRYFCVHTEQARLIKILSYGIDRHLYLKQTRNAWLEMYITISCVVTFDRIR
jgi:hypothetical protein